MKKYIIGIALILLISNKAFGYTRIEYHGQKVSRVVHVEPGDTIYITGAVPREVSMRASISPKSFSSRFVNANDLQFVSSRSGLRTVPFKENFVSFGGGPYPGAITLNYLGTQAADFCVELPDISHLLKSIEI